MGGGSRRAIATALVLIMISAACSSSGPTTPAAAPDGSADSESSVEFSALEHCEAGADRVIQRLETFLASLPKISPDDFLALDEIEGLASFQDDIAQILADTTDQSSTLCNLDGLQELVTARLSEVERNGLLAEFLIATIRDGRELKTADLRIGPGDDVEAVLGLLDDGSSVTFEPGTYTLERPLLIQRSITLVGAGAETTVIASTSQDAAIVVVGRGELIMRDLAVEHRGDIPASIVLAFGRPVDLADVRISGGTADAEGGAGNGVVLSDEIFGGLEPVPGEQRPSVISQATVRGNEGAGIAVTGALAPVVQRSDIADNGLCGLCFFGPASGRVIESSIHGNDVGVQIGDAAKPTVEANTIERNTTAGIVAVGTSAPVLRSNTIEGADAPSPVPNDQAALGVGIAIQESSAAIVEANEITDVPVAISVLSDGRVRIVDNIISAVDVGIQIDETAAPIVERNRISESNVVGILLRGRAGGRFVDNELRPGDGIGLVAEGDAEPVIEGLQVDGGAVAIAYNGDAAGVLSASQFVGQEIGIQLDERSSPEIVDVEVIGSTSAGLVARGSSTATFRDSAIRDSGEVGFAIVDRAEPTLEGNTFDGGQSGGTIVGSARPRVVSNNFLNLDVGLQIGEDASPTIEDNDFTSMGSAGLIFVGDSAGRAVRNVVRDPGLVAVQLGESAHPDLDENVLFLSHPAALDDEGADGGTVDPGDAGAAAEVAEVDVEVDATVGILYADESAGTATANQIIGFVIGIQMGDTAAPELRANTIDGGALIGVGILFRDDAAGEVIANETASHTVGFQISDNARPHLEANVVTTARNVAFLVQGDADPVLERNVCPVGLAGIGMLDGTDPVRVDNDCTDVFGE